MTFGFSFSYSAIAALIPVTVSDSSEAQLANVMVTGFALAVVVVLLAAGVLLQAASKIAAHANEAAAPSPFFVQAEVAFILGSVPVIIASPCHLAAGVLRELCRRGVSCGLVTGNARRIAKLKMSRCGLDFAFSFGGFGDEGDERSELFPVAIAEARELGIYIDRLCYVGDTPRDIAAARQAGVPVVAAATGRFDSAALHAAGGEMTFDSYEQPMAICDVLMLAAGSLPRSDAAHDESYIGFNYRHGPSQRSYDTGHNTPKN